MNFCDNGFTPCNDLPLYVPKKLRTEKTEKRNENGKKKRKRKKRYNIYSAAGAGGRAKKTAGTIKKGKLIRVVVIKKLAGFFCP